MKSTIDSWSYHYSFGGGANSRRGAEEYWLGVAIRIGSFAGGGVEGLRTGRVGEEA